MAQPDDDNMKGVVEVSSNQERDQFEVAPKLGQLTRDVLFGDVWERQELSKRDRSLMTVAMLCALYRTEELRGHVRRALDNGVTPEELSEVVTHVAFYGGWPTGANAARVVRDVFDERGIIANQRV